MQCAGCERLFVAREAAGQRVTARIDDLGVGQDNLDEPCMQKIVAGLVGEEGRPNFR